MMFSNVFALTTVLFGVANLVAASPLLSRASGTCNPNFEGAAISVKQSTGDFEWHWYGGSKFIQQTGLGGRTSYIAK